MTATPDACPARRTRSPRGEGDKLREEILVAAEAILVESNDESALSIRAIASAVGVTPPSIYLHFADRNELVFAVCERQAEHLQAAMDAAAADGTDGWDRIRRRGYAYLRWGVENPEHYRILMMSRADITPERFIDERLRRATGIDTVAADLESAAAEGLIALVNDPVKETELLWMVIHGVVSLFISKPNFPFGTPTEVYDEMLDLVFRGLAPRG